MEAALEQARQGLAKNEPPFGCVVANDRGEIIAAEYDRVQSHGDMSSHAETLAVRSACRFNGGPNLKGFTVVTTVEPCAMCFTTAWLNDVSRIIYGATMADIYEVSGKQQREMTITAEEMNRRSGNLIELKSDVMREACIDIFRGYQWQC